MSPDQRPEKQILEPDMRIKAERWRKDFSPNSMIGRAKRDSYLDKAVFTATLRNYTAIGEGEKNAITEIRIPTHLLREDNGAIPNW